MHHLLQQACDRVLSGLALDRETARSLALSPDQEALYTAADTVRRQIMGDRFHLCSIINAKSGNCSEDCLFCAQSARYQTNIDAYDFIPRDQAMTMAMDNDQHGVHRLSLVTSGRAVNKKTLQQCAPLYKGMEEKTSMLFCASMGLLSRESAEELKEMGVSRYHCNLEANRDFFPRLCTRHTWEDKVATLQTAWKSGMSICSGGIIGMGETMEDRIEMAFELRELGVTSIPLNILTPIKGTPLADFPSPPLRDVLTTVALFRLVNPDAVIRMAGGRQQLGDDQYRCFAAGANGAIVGNYLTTTGSSIAEDLQVLSSMGFTVTPPCL